MATHESLVTLAILRGHRTCATCKGRGHFHANRQVAQRQYTLKVACQACQGNGWHDVNGQPIDIYV